jgi:ubiquinone/menaquinone biosynthesis C-methylase UbiE
VPVQIPSEGFLNPDITVGLFGVKPDMRVADFGCGAGHITILIAQKIGPDGKITALDIMEDKLESVRERGKASGLENIDTVRANLEVIGSSGLANASQDMVILATILFQSTKKAEILKEVSRVLKPGGKVALVEWKKGAGGFGPPDELRTSESDMLNMFKEVGFINNTPLNVGKFHYGFIFTR